MTRGFFFLNDSSGRSTEPILKINTWLTILEHPLSNAVANSTPFFFFFANCAALPAALMTSREPNSKGGQAPPALIIVQVFQWVYEKISAEEGRARAESCSKVEITQIFETISILTVKSVMVVLKYIPNTNNVNKCTG